jgi:hypothetical protein
MRRSWFWVLATAVAPAALAVVLAARGFSADVAGGEVWLDVVVMDHNQSNGGNSHFLGRLDRRTFNLLVAGEFKGFVKLEGVCWWDDNGKVVAQTRSGSFKDHQYFDSNHIYRFTPLKDAYVEKSVRPALSE